METTQPHNCAYKLGEHDILSGDAKVIEGIVNELLLPALKEKMDGSDEVHEYPEEVMEAVRQNLDLESDDTSMDEEIMKMSKLEVFNRLLTWNGLVNYGGTVAEWVNDVFGVDLSELD